MAFMFDDAGFPWWLQGQIGIVRSPDSAAPVIEARALLDMIETPEAPHWEELHIVGVYTIVRPGVDGGVMGLFTDSMCTRTMAAETLERCAWDAGYQWLVLSEPQFIDAIASPWP